MCAEELNNELSEEEMAQEEFQRLRDVRMGLFKVRMDASDQIELLRLGMQSFDWSAEDAGAEGYPSFDEMSMEAAKMRDQAERLVEKLQKMQTAYREADENEEKRR